MSNMDRPQYWKVVWTEKKGGKRKAIRFNNVKEAVAVRKLKRQEGLECDVISLSKAYPPQKYSGTKPQGHLWCPWCVHWRIFKVFALKKDGIKGPDLLRCSFCYISSADYYIRRYNGLLGVVTKEQLKKG